MRKYLSLYEKILKKFECIHQFRLYYSYIIRKCTPLIENEVVVYRIFNNYIKFLHPLNELEFNNTADTLNLPNMLIIKEGFYAFNNEIYDCTKPGNYYFIQVQKTNQQRVVIDRKSALKTALMFSLLFIRGNKDDYKTNTALKKTALSRFLINTCGRTCEVVQELLTEAGFQARVVQSITNRKPNSYNDRHSMIEVFDEKEQKFFLVDVDKKMYFTNTKGNVLNIYEFSEHLNHNKTVKFHNYIRTSMVDWGNFQEVNTGFNYQFIEQSFYFSDKELLKLYKRICAIPLITKEHTIYGTLFNTPEVTKKLKGITLVSNNKFQNIAYNLESI